MSYGTAESNLSLRIRVEGKCTYSRRSSERRPKAGVPVSQKNFNSQGASVRRFKTAAFYVPSPAAVKRRGRSQVGRLVPLTQERHCISHSLPQEGWGLTRMMKSAEASHPDRRGHGAGFPAAVFFCSPRGALSRFAQASVDPDHNLTLDDLTRNQKISASSPGHPKSSAHVHHRSRPHAQPKSMPQLQAKCTCPAEAFVFSARRSDRRSR